MISPGDISNATVKITNRHLIVFSVALAVFMVRLDSYIVNVSLPAISRYFQVDTSDVSWVIISYLLIMTSSMLISGKLGDRVGLKKTFIGGYLFFTAGSLFCGLSPNIVCLDISRGIQGLGGAMMVTSAFAIISHYLPAEETGWAFGICSFANSLGIMVGAPLGGLITGFISWQWVFLINIPVGIFAVFVARRALPPENSPGLSRGGSPFDLAGSALSAIGLSALVFTLSMGGEMGWTSEPILLCATLAGITLFAFVIRETTLADPILDFAIFKNRDFALANLTTLLALMLLAGGNFLLPFYLELVKGLRPEYVGAVILIYAVVYMPIGLYSGKLSDRINPVSICRGATGLSVIACLSFAFSLSLPGILPAVFYLVILAVAYGFFFASNNHLVMSLAPPDHQGSASGIYSTVMNIGMVLGVCLFEGVFSHFYPTGVSMNLITPERATTLQDSFITAFRYAFIAGGIFCFLSFICSLLTGRTFISSRIPRDLKKKL